MLGNIDFNKIKELEEVTELAEQGRTLQENAILKREN